MKSIVTVAVLTGALATAPLFTHRPGGTRPLGQRAMGRRGVKEFVSPADAAWQKRRTIALEDLRSRIDDQKRVDDGLAAWEKANPHPGGTIAEVADHIDHIRTVAGIDDVGIGADFYDAGTTSMVPGLTDVTRYPYLFAELPASENTCCPVD